MWLLILALLLLAAGAVSAHHIPGGDVVTGSQAIGPVPQPYTDGPPCAVHGWDCLLRDYEHAADKAA